MNLKVVEIFHSLQGEGANVGTSAIFIRLSDCNKNCWFCDTDWSKGTIMTVSEVLSEIMQYSCNTIIWTGGEPTLQLNKEILACFSNYFNCIETNGSNPVPVGIDYISCSPKVDVETLHKSFPKGVNEFRYPFGLGEQYPPEVSLLPKAKNYFISPLFLGESKKRFETSDKNIKMCIDFVKINSQWRLSIQTHKLLNIR